MSDGARIIMSIHRAPASRLAMRSVAAAELRDEGGVVGDRYESARHRHVSLQSADQLELASTRLGRTIDPGMTRRNITVSGGPLPSTPGARLVIVQGTLGELVELQVVRIAAPCKVMDDTVGPGGHLALRGLGGIICRVLQGGLVTVGDRVHVLRVDVA